MSPALHTNSSFEFYSYRGTQTAKCTAFSEEAKMIRKSAIATTTLLLAVPLSWAQERAIRPLETNNRRHR
jgi:hypothetical protein